jgi:hypothetical protein
MRFAKAIFNVLELFCSDAFKSKIFALKVLCY